MTKRTTTDEIQRAQWEWDRGDHDQALRRARKELERLHQTAVGAKIRSLTQLIAGWEGTTALPAPAETEAAIVWDDVESDAEQRALALKDSRVSVSDAKNTIVDELGRYYRIPDTTPPSPLRRRLYKKCADIVERVYAETEAVAE